MHKSRPWRRATTSVNAVALTGVGEVRQEQEDGAAAGEGDPGDGWGAGRVEQHEQDSDDRAQQHRQPDRVAGAAEGPEQPELVLEPAAEACDLPAFAGARDHVGRGQVEPIGDDAVLLAVGVAAGDEAHAGQHRAGAVGGGAERDRLVGQHDVTIGGVIGGTR